MSAKLRSTRLGALEPGGIGRFVSTEAILSPDPAGKTGVSRGVGGVGPVDGGIPPCVTHEDFGISELTASAHSDEMKRPNTEMRSVAACFELGNARVTEKLSPRFSP